MNWLDTEPFYIIAREGKYYAVLSKYFCVPSQYLCVLSKCYCVHTRNTIAFSRNAIASVKSVSQSAESLIVILFRSLEISISFPRNRSVVSFGYTPGSSTRKLISSSSFHCLDMTHGCCWGVKPQYKKPMEINISLPWKRYFIPSKYYCVLSQ